MPSESTVKNHTESAGCAEAGSVTHVPLTNIQKLIGRRMSGSKFSKPCFYLQARADVTRLMGLRSRLGRSFGVKVTSNAFLIRALALAAKEYPVMTAAVDSTDPDNSIKVADAINVGFAVNAPQGLLVPVIKEADKKTLAEIARLEKLLTEKARSKKLTLVEMEGQTIALSNLGAYGIDSFVGIVPPLASAILAVGNVVRTVVPEDSGPALRKMMSLTLAADNKVASATYAAEFLTLIREQLQNPQTLI
ncbi:MAG: 2-oxo acid dehydrogenase subunit E2 [Planctomycetota bacterium]|jgi:pyruvate dehydrogenase E2 component (dihydrolipoamide acetyltransferase)